MMKLYFTLLLCLYLFHFAKSDTTLCSNDIGLMFSKNRTLAYPNSYFMIDYTGKSVDDLGNYDQCLDLGPKTTYCLLEALAKTDVTRVAIPIYIGLCVPSSCSEADLSELFSTDFPTLIKMVPQLTVLNETLQGTSFHCHQPPEPYSAAAIVALVLCGIIFLLVLSGSTLEGLASLPKQTPRETKKIGASIYVQVPQNENEPASLPHITSGGGVQASASLNDDPQPPKDSRFVIFLKCFAVQPNLKWLFADNTQGGESPLACLNGLRVVMMAWIILGHTLTYSMYPVGFDNDLEVSNKYMKETSFQVVPAAEFAVDVFFYISGFLVMYMLLKELNQRNGKISWVLFYFHRYWRLTPVFAFIMFLYTTLSPHMIEGPFKYQYREAKTDLCLKYWWSGLLYINNFYPTSSGQQCMGWSWFLANDMQFYIFTPIFAILWRKSRIAAWILVIILGIGCIEANWLISDHYNLSPMDPNDDTFNSVLYNKPYTRCIAYLQGIAVAYLLQSEKDYTKNRFVRYIGYIISFGLTFCPVYLTTSFWRSGGEWSRENNLLYISFSRFGFVIGVMFVMYCMHKKHCFFLRKALSAYMWVFLGRLTYTAYLLHPIIIFVQYFSSTRVFHMSSFYVAAHYCTNVMIAYTLGLVFHLCVEKPTANLERLLLPHKDSKK